MSTFTTTDGTAFDHSPTGVVARGALAGVLAGLVFGAIIQVGLGRMTAIGALYTLGDPSLTVGWLAHGFHSALFGAFFGLLVDTDRVRGYATSVPASAAVGAAFATALWAVNIVFVWPVWLNAVSVGSGLPVPNVAVMPLVGHVVWGVLLGAGTAIALSR